MDGLASRPGEGGGGGGGLELNMHLLLFPQAFTIIDWNNALYLSVVYHDEFWNNFFLKRNAKDSVTCSYF